MRATMTPFAVDALGRLKKELGKLEIKGRIKNIQTTILLIPATIMKRVLETCLLSLKLVKDRQLTPERKTRNEYTTTTTTIDNNNNNNNNNNNDLYHR